VWAWGLRNPYQIAFDGVTGELWAGDVGFQTWEEIDVVEGGNNYGWPVMEGNHCLVEPCSAAGYEPPIVEHLHATVGGDGLAIMGGYVYRGTAVPALAGRYVYGDFNGNVWALEDDGAGNLAPELLTDALAPLTGIAEDADGELHFLSTTIRKLVPGTPPGGTFPETISATGCRDPEDPTLPASYVIPYAPNVELWSDGAAKDRWIGLPDGTTIDVLSDGDWGFPVGTVLMKDFTVGGQLIETRLFVRHDDGGWGGYSYEWDDLLTDATLLPGGKSKVVGSQTWLYPSRAQCLSCHTVVAGRSLGLTTGQLNGDFLYPSTGLTANQLTTLETIGMLSAPLPGPPATLPVLPGPAQPSFPLAERARGYLQANCAHCHAPGGPTQATMDLRFDVSEPAMNVCDVAPNFGDLGIPGAFLVTPGNPGASVLSARMHALDGDRMPPLATSVADAVGTQVVDGWITALVACEAVTNQPPVVTITEPSEGAVFAEGAEVMFAGLASDVEDGDLTTAIVWTSDLDGVFGSGGTVATTALSPGIHAVTASVIDAGGLDDEATLHVTVAPAAMPTVVTLRSVEGEDGHVVESSEMSGVGGLAVANGATIDVGDQATNAQFRGIVSFDTSIIPDDAIIVSATLRLRRAGTFGTNPFGTHGACLVDVRTGGFGDSTVLEAGDFEAPATVSASAALTAAPANGDWSTGTLNAAGVSAIDTAGTTQLRIAFTLDDDDDGTADRITYSAGDVPDPTVGPELVVTYVSGSTTSSTTVTTTSTSLPTTSSTSTSTTSTVPTTTSTTTSLPTTTSMPPTSTSTTTLATSSTTSTSTSTSVTSTTSTSSTTSTASSTTSSSSSTTTTVPTPTTTSTTAASSTSSTTSVSTSSSTSTSTVITTSTVPQSTTTTSVAGTTSTIVTTTVTSSSTTTSTAPPVETCTNGADDDADGLADCADGDCALHGGCPAACGSDPAPGVLGCRTTALRVRTLAVTAGESVRVRLVALLDEAATALAEAEAACQAGERRAGRRRLARFAKQMAKYARRVGSKAGRRAMPEPERRDLVAADARTLRTLSRTLRQDLVCPPAS
jgi:uncharacterized repeat protein (TIGR03806 family)